MKVLGKVDSGTYLVQVSHTELEKVFDKYYGNMPNLNVGDVVDLGDGYSFRSEIKSVCEKMLDAMKGFDQKRDVMLRFADMVTKLPPDAV